MLVQLNLRPLSLDNIVLFFDQGPMMVLNAFQLCVNFGKLTLPVMSNFPPEFPVGHHVAIGHPGDRLP
ncbi:MAG: hypothetical protein GY697_28670 [Desulfobacterales bacterium]|nr:hypothetical protein [Desulfobacterales bacterium]